MGQQSYEQHLVDELLRQGWPTRSVQVRSLRSRTPGGRRLPLNRLGTAPLAVQSAAARYAYGPGLVHRADLRLPAARREVVTVHDLAPLHYPEEGTLPPTAGAQLRHAAAVVTGTRAAARELEEVYGLSGVHVIPHGVDAAFFTAERLTTDERADLSLPQRYVLHTGGASRRKNLALLASAWPAVRAGHPEVGLVLCGPPHPDRTRLFSGLPGCHLLGMVPSLLLRSVLASASVAVVPSAYEGFGLPVLEAMAAGVPVVASRSDAVAEVCADAALVVDPDPDALAAGLGAVLDGTGDGWRARADRHARAHTWESSARAHIAVYKSASRKARPT